MKKIEELLRENVRTLKPYSSARDEYSGEAYVFLDANENAYGAVIDGDYHRYPDPYQRDLKQEIAKLKAVDASKIFLGNGSDEAVDLLLRAFCDPGKDNIILMPPTYGMYGVAAAIHDITVKEVPLTEAFQIDTDSVLKAVDQQTKLIFVCSPNNPTGNCMAADSIIRLLEDFSGMVVVDEAYSDFMPEKSFLGYIETYPNLVVLQTFSKAWGLAGLRLGMAFADEIVIDALNKIKAPYNINCVTNKLAHLALQQKDKKDRAVSLLLYERNQLAQKLASLDFVEKVYPSEANFLLIRVRDPEFLYKKLLENGIVVRNRSSLLGCQGCLRITVGTTEENRQLLSALGVEVSDCEGGDRRKACVERKTSETSILVEINLDGRGDSSISTGIGFFDHMLEQIARHSGCDLKIKTKGDLHVDEHHCIEDTALALGQALFDALGDKSGIQRYGFMVPMDESLAHVALDLSGRSWLEWQAEFKREMIGAMPTEMFYHFFKSFCDTAKCTLHVKADGQNEHHKIEAIYKAFGKVLGLAIGRTQDSNNVPSTKGVL